MKRFKNIVYVSIMLLLLILCVFQSNIIVTGAKEGLQLCLQVIVPSIFPFLFLTSLISNYYTDAIPMFRLLAKSTSVPQRSQHILLSAILGGYPIGAQSVANALASGEIDKETADRLIGFCNNAGPSFIFGLLSTIFTNKFAPIFLWIIHITSAMLVGIILPGKASGSNDRIITKKFTITDILKKSILATSMICGWIIIFRIIIMFARKMFFSQLSVYYITIISGLLELSNGCMLLVNISNEHMRFVLASMLLSLGGACVLLQTKSIIGNISLKKYFLGKVLQFLISLIMSFIISWLLYRA